MIAKVVHQIKKNEDKYKNKGEYFNLINILGRGSSEVGTHTPVLADLLNPFGSHGQGASFLKLFLERVGIEISYDLHIKVEREKRFNVEGENDKGGVTGQVDICIESYDHIIVIENKIYAEDQPQQLYRYFQYAYKQSRVKKISLIYLSMRDQEPTSQSFGEIKYDEKIGYFCRVNN